MMINSVLIVLFFIAIVSIGINLSEQNDMTSPLQENKQINDTYNEFEDSVESLQGDTNSKWNLLRTDNPEEEAEISLLSIPRIASSMPSFVYNSFKSLISLIVGIFGGSIMITYAFTSIILIIIVTSIISIIRSGR